jgi:hypothetical protein
VSWQVCSCNHPFTQQYECCALDQLLTDNHTDIQELTKMHVCCINRSRLLLSQALKISTLYVQDQRTRTMPVYMMPWFSNAAFLQCKRIAAVYRAGQLLDSSKLEVRYPKFKVWTPGFTAATPERSKDDDSRRSTAEWVYTRVGLIGFGVGMNTCDVSGCGGCGGG